MDSLDRILKTLCFKEPEMVPVLPVLLLQGAKELKLSIREYFSKHENIIEGQTLLVQKYGHDGVYGFPHVVEDVEAFGGELMYFESGPPSVGKMAWRSWSDLDKIKMPSFSSSPTMMRTLKTIEGLASRFKGQKLIVGAAIAPFSLPSMLIGTEPWFELLWEDELIREPILNKVLNITKNLCVSWCNAQIQAGADVVVLADGIASATCIMRNQFEKYALPVIKDTIHAIEGTVVYEPVGHIEPFVDLLPQIGSGLVILEHKDNIKKCKEALYGKMSVMGNLNNIEILRWDKEIALQKCLALLNQVAPGGGFILSTQGPEIPWGTSDEVIHAIVESVKIWQKTRSANG
ncbi:MAG: uroporphyrinogen decarboxylase family protein [Candidatus Brocadiae bacterium]|nr:uroporphyrinogen decarboxylase family protein [Candidatus Brocadiia bacterium]